MYRLKVENVELPVPTLPPAFDGLNILHLSDLHITRWTNRLQRWRRRLAVLQPDLAVITGDLGHRGWRWKQSLPNVLSLLEVLQPPLGCYFILGNHDALDIGPELQKSGPIYMVNKSVVLQRGEQRLAIIGLAQHRRIDTDIPAAMRNVLPTDFKLMLLHYPDLIYAAAAAGADVCLAGHTHGGQICLPAGRPIIRHDSLPARMCTGIHRVGSTWLVINRGIGKAGLRLRLFCPPHVMMLTLRRKHKDPLVAQLRAADMPVYIES
jgi:uncharacterized protein